MYLLSIIYSNPQFSNSNAYTFKKTGRGGGKEGENY
jgi:hypothetical protein